MAAVSFDSSHRHFKPPVLDAMRMQNAINQLTSRLSEISAVQWVRDLPLLLDRRNSYSQHGEDTFLLETIFPEKRDGVYVDIGGSHPIRISNTYALYRRGWSGVVVEPIASLVKVHKRWRPRDTQVECLLGDADGASRFYQLFPSVMSTACKEDCESSVRSGCVLMHERVIPQLSLKTLFEKYVGSRHVDFMSVDIEGLDQLVAEQLRSLPHEDVPDCLCIECNTDNAMKGIIATLSGIYRQHRKIGCNLIFWNRDQ